jgi:hypothetical protein
MGSIGATQFLKLIIAINLTMPSLKQKYIYIFNTILPESRMLLPRNQSAWVGVVDETTVFKYPFAPGDDMSCLETERQLLELVGVHERIIQLKGDNDTGLYLERAPNGTLSDYLLESPPE